jgi:hypothetical protein
LSVCACAPLGFLGRRPAAAEAQLAFAALTDVFGEVLDGDLATLPEPQRAALLERSGVPGNSKPQGVLLDLSSQR